MPPLGSWNLEEGFFLAYSMCENTNIVRCRSSKQKKHGSGPYLPDACVRVKVLPRLGVAGPTPRDVGGACHNLKEDEGHAQAHMHARPTSRAHVRAL